MPLSFPTVELARRHDFPARKVAEIKGAPVLSIQEHEEGDPRGARVGADRGAECVFPCAADEVRDRGGDSACAGGAHPRLSR